MVKCHIGIRKDVSIWFTNFTPTTFSGPTVLIQKSPLRALILGPTRELALQVSFHLNSLLTSIKDPAITDKDGTGIPPLKNLPPHVSVAAIVGGMSAQKQKRILDRGVDVLVATPGRLWDIMQDVGEPVNISFEYLLTIAYRTTI